MADGVATPRHNSRYLSNCGDIEDNTITDISQTCVRYNADMDCDSRNGKSDYNSDNARQGLAGQHELNGTQGTCNGNNTMSTQSSPPPTQQSSQFPSPIPNQQLIERLDCALYGLNHEAYIDKLLELGESERIITWYRTMLLSRAGSIESCPKGRLITRKSTQNATSCEKYAKDCFILQSFIDGDDSDIDCVFSRSSGKDDLASRTVNLSSCHNALYPYQIPTTTTWIVMIYLLQYSPCGRTSRHFSISIGEEIV